MKRWLFGALLALCAGPAHADYLFTVGAGTTAFAFTCFVTKVCFAHVGINSAGTEIFTAGSPAFVSVTNTVPVSGSLTSVGTLTTITNPVAVTQSTSPWVISGTIQPGNTANTTPWLMTSRTVGNAGAILDAPVGAGTAPVNMFAVGGQFNSTPITLTNLQSSALQLDTNGFLKVNVVAGGAGGGAVTVADGADVTQGAKADAAWTTGSGSAIAILKAIDRDVLTPAALTPVGATAATSVTCASASSTCQLKSSAGNFYGAYANCSAACWLFIINTTTTPTNATLTAGTASGNLSDCVPIAAGLAGSVSYPTFPRAYSVGMYAAISSTACPVLTLATTGTLVTGQAQ
jgi:hypothetical protein